MRPAPINGQALAGDVAAVVRGKKGEGGFDAFRGEPAGERLLFLHAAEDGRLIGEETQFAFGEDRAEVKAIYADAMDPEVARQPPREADQPALAGEAGPT